MGKFARIKRGIETVGELRLALVNFPDDMPVSSDWGMDCLVMVGQVEPSPGETTLDPRGYVFIAEDDGSDDGQGD